MAQKGNKLTVPVVLQKEAEENYCGLRRMGVSCNVLGTVQEYQTKTATCPVSRSLQLIPKPGLGFTRVRLSG